MRKAVCGMVLAVLFIPSVAFAQADTKAGIEFLTPLVQTIIGLLHERIAVLSAQVSDLESRVKVLEVKVAQLEKSPAPMCVGTVESAPAPVVTAPAPQIDTAKQAAIDNLKSKISALDRQIDKLNQERLDEKYTFEKKGSGVSSYEIEQYNNYARDSRFELEKLQNQRQSLEKQLQLLK